MRVKSAAVLAVCAVSFGLAACEAQHASAGPGGVGTPAVTTVRPTTAEPTADQRQDGRFVVTMDHLAGTGNGRSQVSFDVEVPQVKAEGKGVNWSAGREFDDGMVQALSAYVGSLPDRPTQVTAEAASRLDVTIPWSALQAQLTPGMLTVLSSERRAGFALLAGSRPVAT
ncbi:hypothetical protein GPX89_27510 [Nocardia sp. ET3-3]|uniref:Lipoprotein n=1 Tax=Nocardia terrae TaxID=2675851 RepID=A0A7K1V2W7_9NOCA|nr:hypothetical protein [Nocardia terrae]MVU80983.1 hypothetical protein [Nocardia terrae]